MGITAISHTSIDGGHRFVSEPEMSVVTKHRSHLLLKQPGLRDCMEYCAYFAFDKSTDLPCLGVLLVDNSDPNCVIFVEHTPPTQPEIPPQQRTEPPQKPEPDHQVGGLTDTASFFFSLTIFGLLFDGLVVPTAQTLLSLCSPSPLIAGCDERQGAVWTSAVTCMYLWLTFDNPVSEGFAGALWGWWVGGLRTLCLGWTFAAVTVCSVVGWRVMSGVLRGIREIMDRGARDKRGGVDAVVGGDEDGERVLVEKGGEMEVVQESRT